METEKMEKIYETKPWKTSDEKIVMGGRAKWIKIWETDSKTQIVIFPNKETIEPCVEIYKDADWELKDGIFRMTGTHKEWEEICGRIWNPNGCFDHVDNIFTDAEANKYENPKSEEKQVGSWLWWREKKVIKVWKRGNYFIKGAESKRTIVMNANIVVSITGE